MNDPMYRPLGLETDLNNPNFAGPRNPDDLLWVQFSNRAVQDNYRTRNEGRPIFQDQLWIEIRVPGNQLLTIERPANDEDKLRFPRQWNFYQQSHASDGQQTGTPLTQWPLLRPSQIEELKALRFYTVEQVAFASDQQIGTLGMLAGMAPMAFRERARLYLETARDNAVAIRQQEEIQERDRQIAEMKAAQEESERRHREELDELRTLIRAATDRPEKRGPGRPRKQEQAA